MNRLLEAAGIYAAYGFFRLLPVDAASALGGVLLRLIGPWLPSHCVALGNLKLAFPELDSPARERIAKDMWRNLGRIIGEFPHPRCFVAGPRMEVLGAEHVANVLAAGRPGIFVSAHLGNWEVSAIAVKSLGLDLALVSRPPNNRLVARLLRRARRRFTPILILKGTEGARHMIQLIRQGHSIGMLIDQKLNDGIPVPFFGRNAMTAPGLARLAHKYDLPVYPSQVIRLKGARFRLVVHPALSLDWAHATTAMGEINRMLEGWIRERPDQWLWIHRRWPK